MSIKYLRGDATNPIGEGNKLIVHCCNNKNRWGRGFVVALSKKWSEPERKYREWGKEGSNFDLGQIQLVDVEPDITVCNMIGQHDTEPKNNIPPIRYYAIQSCLRKVAAHCQMTNSSVHAPRFGAGLAGGKWEKIEELINEELVSRDIDVYIYDLE